MVLSKLLGRLTATLTLSLILAACGNPSVLSGTYEADMGGGRIRVEFQGGNKARVSLFGPPSEPAISHNTVYTTDGNKLHFTTDEPMGAPMDLVYEKGVLSDGMGMVFEKK